MKEIKKGTSEEEVDKYLDEYKSEKDIKGSQFGLLRLRQKKAKKKAITVRWEKIPGAKYYVLYGAKCGRTETGFTPYKKIKKVKGTTYNQKKRAKATYYKYLVIAYSKDKKVLATSKTVHITTKGGKYGNDKGVKVKKTKMKISLRSKKKNKIKAKSIVQSKKLPVRRHRQICYESTNKKIAQVTKKGLIKPKKKGKCYIYVYTQNGLYKKVAVTVTK